MAEQVLEIKQRRYAGEREVLSARLPQDLIDELSEIARQTGRSRNEIIEKCLIFAVEHIEIKRDF